MNMFLIGVLAGAGAFALLYLVLIISKIHTGLLFMHQSIEIITKAVNLSLSKIAKIEKVTDATMIAAENFVDAIRESTEQIMVRPPNRRHMGNNQQFDDLRQAFDDGIREIEEDESDEEGDELKDSWKK